MKVVIVGAGVVGLCVAESLQRGGAEVTVLDANAFGAAASAGNAGWVTPSHAAPLPMPGTMPQAIRWMFNPGSPLLVRPLPSVSYARWLWDFAANTRVRSYSAGLAAMVALAERVVPDYEALAARCSFEMHQKGLLYVGRSDKELDKEMELHHDQQMLGYRGTFDRIGREELLAREPALRDGVAGAILAVDDRHVRPETVTRGLAEHLRDRGTELHEKTAVSGVSTNAKGWLVATAGGTFKADRVVLANGVATATLLAPLGVKLPLQGAKGYSVTVEDPRVRPNGPIYLLENKVGVSPYEGAVRLAGTLELGSRGLSLSKSRVAAIELAAEQSLRDWGDHKKKTVWAGFRPVLPDGLPAIGPVPGKEGLFVATGHAMLGITMAPTTAELLAPVVLGEKPSLELAPFSIARFGNRGG
jgi:D-amino-acid dehydrogenase